MKQIYPRLSQVVQGFRIREIATRIAGVFLLTLLLNVSVFAADRYSVAAGNWNSTSTWSDAPGGIPGFSVPTTGDNVFIAGTYMVTLNVTNTAPTAINNLSISSVATFSIFGNNSLYIAGNWVNDGIFTAGTGTGAIWFVKAGGTQTLNAGASSFYNLTHNGAGTLQLVTSDLTVANNLINIAGGFDPNGLNITNGSLFTVSGGIFSGGAGSLTTVGVTVSGGTLVAPSGAFNVSGNWLRSSGTFTPGTNTVSFTAASGTQTLNSSGTGSPLFNILHSGAGILQLLSTDLQTNGFFTNGVTAGNFDANGRIHTVTGLTTMNGGSYLAKNNTQTLNGGLVINSGASFTGASGAVNTFDLALNAGGTLTATSGVFNVKGNWTNNGGTFTPGGNTITINGSTAQPIGGSSATTFNSLTIANTAASVATLAADITVLATLNVIAAASLNLASQNLTIAGTTTPTLTGAFSSSTSTVFYTNPLSIAIAAANYYNLNLTGGPRTSVVTIGIGNVLAPGSVTALAGTVSFYGNGNQSIPAITYTNLQTANSGTKTLAGNTTVISVLTFGGASANLDLSGNTLTLSGSGNPFLVTGGGTFISSTSTVIYSNSGATNIAGVNYYNLTCTNNTGANTRSF